MTSDEIIQAVQAPSTFERRAELAEELLAGYRGDDKEILEELVWEMLLFLPERA